jgi:hypothetical protein
MPASATTVTSGSLWAAMNFPMTDTAGRPVAHAHPRRPAGAQGAGTHLPGGPADGPQLHQDRADPARWQNSRTARACSPISVSTRRRPKPTSPPRTGTAGTLRTIATPPGTHGGGWAGPGGLSPARTSGQLGDRDAGWPRGCHAASFLAWMAHARDGRVRTRRRHDRGHRAQQEVRAGAGRR